MEKKKRAVKRKQYLNDFTVDVNGEYVYTGKYYCPETDSSQYSRLRCRTVVFVLLSAACVFAAGILPAAGSINCFYVILPFLALIITCCIAAEKTLRLFSSGSSVREYVYEKTVPLIPGWIKAEIICASVTLLSELIFLLINGFGGRAAQTAAFLILIAFAASAGFLSLRSFLGIRWK